VKTQHCRLLRAQRIALVADSHGQVRASLLRRLAGVDLIVHAGDLGARAVLSDLEGIAPLCAIAGNNDTPGKWPAGEAAICSDLPAVFRIVLKGGDLIAIHGHQFPQVATRHARLRAAFPDARCIVYGHSHRRCVDTNTSPWIVNPGASGRARAYDGAGGLLLTVAAQAWQIETL
jgi:uncharacterized protein